MQSAVVVPRPPRSAGMRGYRDRHFSSNTTSSSVDDDNLSLSSGYSGSVRTRGGLPRISTSSEFSAVRAATIGVARMKHERSRGRKSNSEFLSSSLNLETFNNPRSGRRTSIYSLSDLANAGAKIGRRKRSTLDNWGQRTTPGVMKYFDKNLSPAELFRRCVRLVQMFASLCQYKYETETQSSDVVHTVFTQYLNDNDGKPIDGGLAFDASFYKANRKMRVSAEVKNILSLPPDQRTDLQKAKVLFALRSIRAFAEYPQRIQHKLINVGWLETHTSKRAILRQGHIPQAFYFVLSGSAVVTVMGENDAFARTVHFLRRGDSFGELAILHDTQRQSTVISREPIELLVISREDFIDIFMLAGGIKHINDPDHQKFIRNIECLKGWPTELMASNPKKCLFHFFRSGSVLVRDSNHTDWIYIIKSGSCQVLKKLKEVKSQLTEHKERVVGFENVRSMLPKADSRTKLDRARTKLSIVTLLLPKQNLRSLLEEDVLVRDDCAVIEQVAAAQGILASFRKLSAARSDVLDTVSLPGDRGGSTSPRPLRRAPSLEGPRRASVPVEASLEKKASDFGRKQPLKRNVGFKEPDESRSTDILTPSKARRRKNWSPVAPSPVLSSRSNSPRSPGSSPSPGPATEFMRRARSRSLRHSIVASPKTPDDDESSMPQQKISVIDEGAQKQSELRITEADLHPMFVQVAKLCKGDTFGVQALLFDDQPSLSLVSNGAECIMISKKFYLSHCTDAMKRRLLTTETPFPNDDALQRSLQDKVNWNAYRKKTLRSVVDNMPYQGRRSADLQIHDKYKGKDMELCQELNDMLTKLQHPS